MTAIACLARARDWELVVAFGSRARHESRPESDFDLAILRGHGSVDKRGLERALEETNLDVNWLDEASWLMWAEVARDGALLFQARPGLFEEFILQATLRKWNSEIWRRRDRAFIRRIVQGRLQLNSDLVARKAAQLAEYLNHLEPLTQLSLEQFAADKLRLFAAERLIELMVECAGTINTEVGQAVAGTPPSDYYSSFFGLVGAGWISQDLAVELAEWARMRNALVHRYDTLATDEFTRLLSGCVQPWRAYLGAISSHLP